MSCAGGLALGAGVQSPSAQPSKRCVSVLLRVKEQKGCATDAMAAVAQADLLEARGRLATRTCLGVAGGTEPSHTTWFLSQADML